MEDEPTTATAPEGQSAGQAAGNPPTEGTPAAPAAGTGQATPAAQPPTGPQTSPTIPAAAPGPADPTFFDPTDLDPTLRESYKGMQGAFTKKMQALSKQGDDQQQAIEAYRAFMADPVANAQRVIAQYGGGQQPAQPQAADPAGQQGNQPWEPQTWDEVRTEIQSARTAGAQEAIEQVMQQLSPYLQNVKDMRTQSIEHQLDQIDGEWRKYEDKMKTTMRDHPTMVKDPAMLYRMSVPSEVLESRANQHALRVFQQKGQAALVSGKSTIAHTEPGTPKPAGSFNEAVQQARVIVAREGK